MIKLSIFTHTNKSQSNTINSYIFKSSQFIILLKNKLCIDVAKLLGMNIYIIYICIYYLYCILNHTLIHFFIHHLQDIIYFELKLKFSFDFKLPFLMAHYILMLT